VPQPLALLLQPVEELTNGIILGNNTRGLSAATPSVAIPRLQQPPYQLVGTISVDEKRTR
jgi:hypothetical protein